MHGSNSAISARCSSVAITPKQFYGGVCEGWEGSHAGRWSGGGGGGARERKHETPLRNSSRCQASRAHSSGTREGLGLVKMDANDLAAYKK